MTSRYSFIMPAVYFWYWYFFHNQMYNQNMIYHKLAPDCRANYGESELNLEY